MMREAVTGLYVGGVLAGLGGLAAPPLERAMAADVRATNSLAERA